MIKNLPAMQEIRVRSLAWENPLEEDMATHSRILAWRIPWTERPGELQSVGLHSQTQLKQHSSSSITEELKRKKDNPVAGFTDAQQTSQMLPP